MARKVSAGSRARRAALSAVREALERGELPVEAAELLQGSDAEFWAGPDGRVYVRPLRALVAGSGPVQRAPEVELVVDPRGCSGSDAWFESEWCGRALWSGDMSRLTHWRAADSTWPVLDEV
ncbi:hypothetical protein [Streptomyces sp. 8N706]|uniref:hypothetical protein n=1 Tax=Streptomyces sp. 8N706 TaxID=3457416 RepID=UPI003FD4EDE1